MLDMMRQVFHLCQLPLGRPLPQRENGGTQCKLLVGWRSKMCSHLWLCVPDHVEVEKGCVKALALPF